MAGIGSYKDLVVWQKGIDLVEQIYRVTNKLPDCEEWGLISQMRRAAISVPSNIAEGYGRQATGEYKHHLSISRGSLFELETQLLICQRLRYLVFEDLEATISEIQQIGKMLTVLISKIRCSKGTSTA